jgi:hypothetical protein
MSLIVMEEGVSMIPLGFDLNEPGLPAQKPIDVPRSGGEAPTPPAELSGPIVPRDSERGGRRTARNGQVAAGNPARGAKPSNFRRAMGAVRAVLPTVQKLLPLLEGNIAWTAANFLAPSGQSSVDLTPVKDAINKIHADQVAMRGHVAEYDTAFSRIEDQLKTVTDALERNANEQKDLSEDINRLRSRTSTILWIVFGLLIVSIATNVFFYLQMLHSSR